MAPMLLALTCLAADGPPRERFEWLNVWIAEAERDDLNRVLMIGDSIVVGYYDEVARRLEGRAACARLTTSRCAGDAVYEQELELVLAQYRWDVIQLNNGLHGFGFSEDEYRAGLERVLALVRRLAPTATLVWATTTPMRRANSPELSPQNERVITRNQIAAELVEAAGWRVNDLYGRVIDHPELQAGDGVHFSDDGRRALGEQVAATLEPLIPAG